MAKDKPASVALVVVEADAVAVAATAETVERAGKGEP